MAQGKKPVVKEVVVRQARGIDFKCPKFLKKLRHTMTKAQFRMMILNEKSFQLKKKQKSGSSKNED